MNIGFLGAGRMATALLRGLLDARVATADEIRVSDPVPAARDRLAQELGVRAELSNQDAVRDAEVVLLCVKPADVPAALAATEGALAGKLLISIVAGLSIAGLERMAPGARVVRAMPNTPAQVGAGATAFAAGSSVLPGDVDLAQRILASVGLALSVPEKHLDAVTGLSGSGPAYVFLVIEALSDGGVAAGLPRAQAAQIAVQTVLGAARLAAESGEHPALLREAVTSPGGTTAAGLAALESAAVRSAFIEAVAAATDRSRELAQ